MKHTKGPWTIDGDTIKAGDSVHTVAIVNPDMSNSSWVQDAALIAASPEMLRVLEIICDECLDLTFDQLCLVKSAIRKAKGQE
jgi:hypothetical protein